MRWGGVGWSGGGKLNLLEKQVGPQTLDIFIIQELGYIKCVW